MDAAERARLGQNLTEQIEERLEAGDWAAVESLGEGLAGEYTLFGMTRILAAYLAYVEGEFTAAQAALASEIRAAAAARDASALRAGLARKREQHLGWHDAYVGFMAAVQSLLAESMGADALRRGLRHVGEALKADLFDPKHAAPVEEQVRAYARSMVSHHGKLTLLEDAEKFTFVNDPCGSGGRLLRDGKYEGPDALAYVEEPSAMTLGREHFQSYCTHCPAWLSQRHQEWYGEPLWVLEPPRTAQERCVFHIYKDPAKIPAEYKALLREP